MPQLWVAPNDVERGAAQALLRGEESRHLVQVLRVRPDEPVEVFDGLGHRWRGRFAGGDVRRARVERLHPLPPNEPTIQVELVQSLPKGTRWDWILEKGTELGATRFQPVYTERTVPRIPQNRVKQRVFRWRRQILSAAKQCERGVLPDVGAPVELTSYLHKLPPAPETEIRLFLAERFRKEAPLPRRNTPTWVRLAVGPEGGWSHCERDALEAGGFRALSLGPRILRADTAAIAAIALVQSLWGDLETAKSDMISSGIEKPRGGVP